MNQRDPAEETILLAATGMSPAVLTETIWALAHEEEPIIPDRVVALTTTKGREALTAELLEPGTAPGDTCIWDELRAALNARGHNVDGRLRFGTSGNDIKVSTAYDRDAERSVELEDIRTAAHNEAIADFVLETIRAIVENPDTQLIASVAGGRKTAGIMIYGSMMLVGREDDRIVHVLVNPPFDGGGLQPPFYFPAQSAATLTAPGAEVLASDAQIELADIPFVPLRNGFKREFGRLPGRFSALVEACRTAVNRGASSELKLSVWRRRKVIAIDGMEIELGPREHLVMLFLAGRARASERAIDSYAQAEPLIETFRIALRDAADNDGVLADWRHGIGNPLEPREITHAVSEIRTKLRRHGAQALVNCLPARGRFSLDLAPDQIDIAD